MSDKKLTDLTSGTAAGTDILYGVKDPTGTPVDRKIAISSIKDYILGLANTWTQNQTFSGTLNKVTITAPATGATLTIADGKTLTVSNTLTLAGTDSTTMTFPSSSGTVATLNASNLFTTAQTVSPLTDVSALTIRSAADGTANILQVQDSSNSLLAAITATGQVNTPVAKLTATTIANLPVTPAAGMMAYVTDGDADLAWGTTVANSGEGGTKYLVWYNGTNWTVVGK